jgi:hypothetical protein
MNAMSRSTAVSCESASSTIGIDEAVQFVERQTFLSIVRCGVRHHLRRQNRTMVQYSTSEKPKSGAFAGKWQTCGKKNGNREILSIRVAIAEGQLTHYNMYLRYFSI